MQNPHLRTLPSRPKLDALGYSHNSHLSAWDRQTIPNFRPSRAFSKSVNSRGKHYLTGLPSVGEAHDVHSRSTGTERINRQSDLSFSQVAGIVGKCDQTVTVRADEVGGNPTKGYKKGHHRSDAFACSPLQRFRFRCPVRWFRCGVFVSVSCVSVSALYGKNYDKRQKNKKFFEIFLFFIKLFIMGQICLV